MSRLDLGEATSVYLELLRICFILGPLLILSCGGNSANTPSSERERPPNLHQESPETNQVTAGSPSPNETSTSTLESGTTTGGVLLLANRGDPPAGFDTLRTSSIALHHVAGPLFGPGNLVMRCRENMYFVCPYLATSWTSNSGFTEWTFTIRDNVFWHDGTIFTAEDAKFWFDLALMGTRHAGKTRAPAYFLGELGSIESVTVLEHNRLRVTFEHRNPFFLEILANPRFKIAHPRHLMQQRISEGEVSISPIDISAVGLGPFVLDSYAPGSLIRFYRSPHYWEQPTHGDALPYLDGIDYVIMPDAFAMDVAFRTGRLDGGARGQGHYLTLERMEGYLRDIEEGTFFAKIEGGNFRLAFNVLKSGPWQDPRIRRAIALWVDKQAAIPSALGGLGWTSPDLGPPSIPIPRHFINWPKFDLGSLDNKRAESKRLMSEAGYPDGFSMGHLCRALNPVPCEFLQAQVAGLGIKLQLKLADEGEWNSARISLNYDTQQGRLTPSPIPEGTEAVYGRYSKNPDAYAKHEDIKIDELYHHLRAAGSFNQRVDLWREFEKYIFVQQTYIIPIAESINIVPYRNYVNGLVIPTEDAHTHTDFATVWLDIKQRRR